MVICFNFRVKSIGNSVHTSWNILPIKEKDIKSAIKNYKLNANKKYAQNIPLLSMLYEYIIAEKTSKSNLIPESDLKSYFIPLLQSKLQNEYSGMIALKAYSEDKILDSDVEFEDLMCYGCRTDIFNFYVWKTINSFSHTYCMKCAVSLKGKFEIHTNYPFREIRQFMSTYEERYNNIQSNFEGKETKTNKNLSTKLSSSNLPDDNSNTFNELKESFSIVNEKINKILNPSNANPNHMPLLVNDLKKNTSQSKPVLSNLTKKSTNSKLNDFFLKKPNVLNKTAEPKLITDQDGKEKKDEDQKNAANQDKKDTTNEEEANAANQDGKDKKNEETNTTINKEESTTKNDEGTSANHDDK